MAKLYEVTWEGLADAIHQSENGDTIRILPVEVITLREHAGTITINKPVTIEAAVEKRVTRK